MFATFVALILVSHLNQKMKEIEFFEDSGHSLRMGEILTKQQEIYTALNAPVPTSL
jgi:hypothetical protein